jgi:glutamate carboxypeptidase
MHISKDQLSQYINSKLPIYLDLLQTMVSINSFTQNQEGVNRLGEFTSNVFSPLGFKSRFIPSTYSNFGNHLLLQHESSHRVDQSLDSVYPTLILVSHLDTVFSSEDEKSNDFNWRPMGDYIYGPGTVDIKGGTMMIYIIMDVLLTHYPQIMNSVNWLIALDASEESLSDDFAHRILENDLSNPLACLIFEGGTPLTETFPIVVARKGRASFKITAKGRSAHAGNYHHKGANAII